MATTNSARLSAAITAWLMIPCASPLLAQSAMAQAQGNSGPDKAHCRRYLEQNGTFWGDPNNSAWQPANIAWLCDANRGTTESPPAIVACFSSKVGAGRPWEQAVAECRVEAGKLAGLPGDPSSWGPDPAKMTATAPRRQIAPAPRPSTPRPVQQRPVTQSPLAQQPLAQRPITQAPLGQSPAAAPPAAPASVSLTLKNPGANPIDAYRADPNGGFTFLVTIAPGQISPVSVAPGEKLVFGVNQQEIGTYTVHAAATQHFLIGGISTATAVPGAAPTAGPRRTDVDIILHNERDEPVDYYLVDSAGQPRYAGNVSANGKRNMTVPPGTAFLFGVAGQPVPAGANYGAPTQTIYVHPRPRPGEPAAEIEQVTAREIYDFVIAYNSMGSGIDGKGAAYVADYFDAEPEKYAYEQVNWGPEGEMEYCINLKPGYEGQKAATFTELQNARGIGDLRQNAVCRAKVLAEQWRRARGL